MTHIMEGKRGTGHLFVMVSSVHGKQERQREARRPTQDTTAICTESWGRQSGAADVDV